jgi:alpha-amylase/alpha-mannosidase (GH57 family)
VPQPVLLALVWHLHQPSYQDTETGSDLLPWTRLHATKDYRDMARALAATPRVHVTFNLTPILLDQLDAIGAGRSDPYLDVARAAAETLTADQRAFLLARFFDVNQERMLAPFARYRELHDRKDSGGAFAPEDLRDIQVLFHLAWADPTFREAEPLRSLVAKGRGFTEEEKATLLDWGVACARTTAGEYRDAAARGQAELITSAYHHPILPLLVDGAAPREVAPSFPLPDPLFHAPEDAAAQIARARVSHRERFGALPRGTWPPEGAVNDAVLALLARAGFAWAASDETVLAAALGARDGSIHDWSTALYRPYRVSTAAGPIAMVFRDRALSDRIGFTYAHWDPVDAARDFVERVRAAGSSVAGGAMAPALVTVILDGENCWESYADDGRPFLEALYGLLERDLQIQAVTVSEALDRVPPTETLTHVPVGSWIRSDLGIWIGQEDKNRAWAELARARSAVEEARRSGAAGGSVADPAMEEIYAAEASDWFWWYGDDHPSVHRTVFDLLFRSRLTRAYERLGVAVPAALRASLRRDASAAEADLAGAAGRAPSAFPYVRPTLDGRRTDFYEWMGAVDHEASGETGAMHRASAILRSVRFGGDGRSLYLWLDADPRAGAADAVIAVESAAGRVARVPLRAGRGVLEWNTAAEDAGEYAAEDVVEMRLPLDALGVRAGEGAAFRVVLERGAIRDEVVPGSGWLVLPAAGPHPELDLWSAT